MITTIRPVIIVSLRVGQTIFADSARTCAQELAGIDSPCSSRLRFCRLPRLRGLPAALGRPGRSCNQHANGPAAI